MEPEEFELFEQNRAENSNSDDPFTSVEEGVKRDKEQESESTKCMGLAGAL